MTFFKQMILLMSMFILLVLISVVYFNFRAATEQVQNQLYSNAQDTVASLSLSLGTAQGDISTMKTMINAVYDSGYYKRILLNDRDGNEIYSRVIEYEDDNTPQWFKEMFPLTAPPASAQVSNGWIPIGILEVTSLESEAYLSLYTTFTHIMRSAVIIAIVTFVLLYLLLHIILRSLKKVEIQANAIGRHEFIKNSTSLFTTEFKNVTIAMNSMVSKVEDIFNKEIQTLKRYHELKYTDEVTALSNRQFLMLKLNELLHSNTAQSHGVIFFISINKLIEENQEIGHVNVDKLLYAFANILREETKDFSEHICTRINGTDFVVVLPNTTIQKSQKSAQSICFLSESLFEDYQANALELFLSIINYNPEEKISNIFSKADYALSKAKLQDPFSVYAHTEESPLAALGKHEFSEMITDAMKENRLTMDYQPVINVNDNSVLHEEAYLRLSGSNGEVYSAGVFMPIVYALNLQTEVDRYVINHVIAQNRLFTSSISINVSLEFIKESSNIQWLSALLKKSSLDFPIYFEISNRLILENIEATVIFAKMLKETGQFFGIDRFFIGDEGLGYLQELKPDYIKIDQAYLHDLLLTENKILSNILLNITKTLNIKLIATSVETNKDRDWLIKHQYGYIQGTFVVEPKNKDLNE